MTKHKQKEGLPHAISHKKKEIVDMREDEEEKYGAKEHGHPGAMILTKHLQS